METAKSRFFFLAWKAKRGFYLISHYLPVGALGKKIEKNPKNGKLFFVCPLKKFHGCDIIDKNIRIFTLFAYKSYLGVRECGNEGG